MRKIIESIKQKKINLILMVVVACLYVLNNVYFKANTTGKLQIFMRCYFNDLMCPLFFISYSNLLLISVNKEIKKLVWIMVFGLCSGLVWEFLAPVMKSSSVTDFVDLVCYLSGSLLYWCIVKMFSGRR